MTELEYRICYLDLEVGDFSILYKETKREIKIIRYSRT